MDYKIENLRDKIYKDYINGVYGPPIIPTDSQVLKKINEITTDEYIPLVDNTKLENIELSGLTTKFSNIIDDISILFDAIEDESRDILDQLTNSLKEHNGVKRELKRISVAAEDIVNGKLGEEYLQYNFTESFDSLDNINILTSDPVDTDAGLFAITDNSTTVVNMNHYIGRRIDFTVTENLSPIIEQGFVGDTNAENILSKNNPKSLLYRIKTSRSTSLKIITSLQLKSDGKPIEINSVGINLDSGVSKGSIRLYYQNGYLWKDVPGLSIQEIKGDNVIFSFKSVQATHVKFEFIKDQPDVPTTNEFYVNIYEVVIGKSSPRLRASLYSKPIILTKYDTEAPVIGTLSCTVDSDVPDGCSLKVYVAPDIKISGQFINKLGLPVVSDSVEITDFDPFASGFVYFSDIVEKQNLSGLVPYRGLDFDWREIKGGKAFGDLVPEVLEFNFVSKKPAILNSLFAKTGLLKYGDREYEGPWPVSGVTGVYPSGWCNTSNPAWGSVLQYWVASGYIASGIDVATYLGIPWDEIADGNGHTYESGINPLILASPYWSGQWLGYGSGYPYHFFSDYYERVIRYGDYRGSKPGWWRPYASNVFASGLDPSVSVSGYLQQDFAIDDGEFYFNGINFYKIYKFDKDEAVLDSSIRLYQFEERPVASDDDEFNHVFRWKYRSALIEETNTLVGKKDPVNYGASNFSGYNIPFPALSGNEDYSDLNVSEVRQHGTNFVLIPNTHYTVQNTPSGTISGICLTPLGVSFPSLSPVGMSFDIKYKYKIKNRYLSTWTGYAIVSPNINDTFVLINKEAYDKKDFRIVKDIVVENLDDGTSRIIEDSPKFEVLFNTIGKTTNSHFKITMHCMADESTGFCSKDDSGQYYIPRESTGIITVPGGIKFVAKLESMKICDLGSLLYDTPMVNDRKCALISDYNNEKFLVVKKPSKEGFPGYLFNTVDRKYSSRYDALLRNKGHYIRDSFVDESGITYTTGSTGSIVVNSLGDRDTSWNDGQMLEIYKNTDPTGFYPLHSTYGHPVNLETTSTIQVPNIVLKNGDIDPRADSLEEARVGTPAWSVWIQSYDYSAYSYYIANNFRYIMSAAECYNRGYLFFNTAENLPTFYSISYSTMTEYDEIAKRFIYKIELESDATQKITPKVRSVRFEINKGI